MQKKVNEKNSDQKKGAEQSRSIFLRVKGWLKEAIEQEMKDKEIDCPQSIVISALKARYREKEGV